MPRTYSTDRYRLTVALLNALRHPHSTEHALALGTIDRDRSSGRASTLGHAIPSIFAEPALHSARPQHVTLEPIADEEPTMLLWGVR
jgi:hypothetical protein